VTLAEHLDACARAFIQRALKKQDGNVRATGEAIGVPYSTLHRHIERLGLSEWLRETYPSGPRQPPR
jgi:transcriptional regulator of acetoin/glycerol metabolism